MISSKFSVNKYWVVMRKMVKMISLNKDDIKPMLRGFSKRKLLLVAFEMNLMLCLMLIKKILNCFTKLSAKDFFMVALSP